jgi:hypothetical protein
MRQVAADLSLPSVGEPTWQCTAMIASARCTKDHDHADQSQIRDRGASRGGE